MDATGAGVCWCPFENGPPQSKVGDNRIVTEPSDLQNKPSIFPVFLTSFIIWYPSIATSGGSP